MQEVAEEQDAAYIPMPKDRGFTPHFDKTIKNRELFAFRNFSQQIVR